jgi:hypothetical protein
VVLLLLLLVVVVVVAVEKERVIFPNDRQIFTFRLYFLAILKWSSGTTPSLELAIRLIRPFAAMFSRSLGLKNTRPKVLPDTDTIFLSVPAQSATLPLCGPSLNKRAVRVVRPANSPTAALSCLHLFCST